MNVYFLRFMEWLYEVLSALFDMFLSMLGLIRILEMIRRELGDA